MANNLIKIQQLDPEIYGYVTGVLGQNFENFLGLFSTNSGFLGTTVLYVTGGAQTILGPTTFAFNPLVPYTGGSGTAPSQQFVTDQITALQAQLNGVLSDTGNVAIGGINNFTYLVQGASGIFTSQLLAPMPTSSSGVVTIAYLNSLGMVDLVSNQVISGIKTFSEAIFIPQATGIGNAVEYSQFENAITALSTEIASTGAGLDQRVHALETTGVSGFAGILSINGFSGRAYIKGCGGISVTQEGNVTRVSGVDDGSQGSTAFLVQTPVPTGVSSLFISFAEADFLASPVCVGYLVNTTGNSLYSHGISGISASGCYAYFSAPIMDSGYQFHLIAGPSGIDSIALQGAPGLDGQTMNYRGGWQLGVTYAPLDYVLLSGASFFCAQTNFSSPSNNPFVAPAFWNLAMSGNGLPGIQGPSGAQGIQGPQGFGGILFQWLGQWSPTAVYSSGNAVYLSGAAFGFTGAGPISGFAQSPYNNPQWSLVINGSGVDTNAFYPASNPSGFVGSGQFLTLAQSGLFAPANHTHNYPTGLVVGGRTLTGSVLFIGTGSVVVSSIGNSIVISGAPSFGGGGGGGSNLNWRGYWGVTETYNSGDAVQFKNGSFLYMGAGSIVGVDSNPASLNSPWKPFTDSQIAFHTGDFDPNKVYYYNDLAHVSDQASSASVTYINTSHAPLMSLNPFTLNYNSFRDCNGVTGYNIFEITSGATLTNNSLYNSGSRQNYLLNGFSPNFGSTGYGVITLIRGIGYFFDSQLTGAQFILTTNASGGSFAGQITGGVLQEYSCDATLESAYQIGIGQYLASGTLHFVPDDTTPDTIYYQDAQTPWMGFKIHVVDQSPWAVFVSGAVGAQGIQGIQGNNGLAFAWRGLWSPTGFYNAMDAVFYNGSSWGATQTVNAVPPGFTSPAWQVIAQSGAQGSSGQNGQNGLAFIWRGTWNTTGIYNVNDAVYYNGSSYAALVGSSGKDPIDYNLTWTLVASSGSQGIQGIQGAPGLAFTWMGEWSSAITYYPNQSVFYEGTSWGTQAQVVGTPPPSAPWFPIAMRGGTIFSWRGDWNSGTPYYDGDAVFYSGSSYGTSAYSSGNRPSDGGTWFMCASQGGAGAAGPSGSKGVNWRGPWLSTGYYPYGDIVSFNGSSYISVSGQSGVYPPYGAWMLFAAQGQANSPMFDWRGTWNSTGFYSGYDMVYSSGSSWSTLTAIASGDSNAPGLNPAWFMVCQGVDLSQVILSNPNAPQNLNGQLNFLGTTTQNYYNYLTGASPLLIGTSGDVWTLIHQGGDVVLGEWFQMDLQTIKLLIIYEGSGTLSLTASPYWAGGGTPNWSCNNFTGGFVADYVEVLSFNESLFGKATLGFQS